MTKTEALNYIRDIANKYSSRMLLKNADTYEMINLATVKLGSKTIHCNNCSMGQRDIWFDMERILKQYEGVTKVD